MFVRAPASGPHILAWAGYLIAAGQGVSRPSEPGDSKPPMEADPGGFQAIELRYGMIDDLRRRSDGVVSDVVGKSLRPLVGAVRVERAVVVATYAAWRRATSP